MHWQVTSRAMAEPSIITELEALTVATQAWCLYAITIVLIATVVVFVASFIMFGLSAVALTRLAFVKPSITTWVVAVAYLPAAA